MGKSIGKNISKNLSVKHGAGMLAMRKNFLIMLKNLQQMQLKIFQKKSFKKQWKQQVI